MTIVDSARTPWWSWTWPALGLLILGVHFVVGAGTVLQAAEAFALVATVFAAVFHAEIVALRVGEPLGTLVLALAVTTIEVALIVSIMIAGGEEAINATSIVVTAKASTKVPKGSPTRSATISA